MNNDSVKETLKEIFDANEAIANFQRERLQTLTQRCLPAYNSLLSESDEHLKSGIFNINSSLINLLSENFDPKKYGDSASADELSEAIESLSQQLRLLKKRIERKYDVFLCHNGEDKREVRSINRQLLLRGVLPWLDEDEMPPGTDWVSKLQSEIEEIKACAVIVGPSGTGPWQKQEINAIIKLFVEGGHKVIPVLLPSCTTEPDLPLFLRGYGWVNYRTLDPDPLEQLVWAITGRSQRR